MLDDLYTRRLVELAADIPLRGRLDAPDASATAHARLCGSTVTVHLAIDGEGRIAAFAQEVKACMLGQAAASIMGRHAVGLDLPAATGLRDAVRSMLKEAGPAPTGAFEAFGTLQAIREYKARHASTLLVFEATVDALGRALASRQAA
jgi:NifU-like protein involved in Fe-S cluster formation